MYNLFICFQENTHTNISHIYACICEYFISEEGNM